VSSASDTRSTVRSSTASSSATEARTAEMASAASVACTVPAAAVPAAVPAAAVPAFSGSLAAPPGSAAGERATSTTGDAAGASSSTARTCTSVTRSDGFSTCVSDQESVRAASAASRLYAMSTRRGAGDGAAMDGGRVCVGEAGRLQGGARVRERCAMQMPWTALSRCWQSKSVRADGLSVLPACAWACCVRGSARGTRVSAGSGDSDDASCVHQTHMSLRARFNASSAAASRRRCRRAAHALEHSAQPRRRRDLRSSAGESRHRHKRTSATERCKQLHRACAR
jgi:hypothetical protein